MSKQQQELPVWISLKECDTESEALEIKGQVSRLDIVLGAEVVPSMLCSTFIVRVNINKSDVPNLDTLAKDNGWK